MTIYVSCPYCDATYKIEHDLDKPYELSENQVCIFCSECVEDDDMDIQD